MRAFSILMAGWALVASPALGAGPAPLERVSIIPLGKVSGRIDHLAIDRAGHRLFVAELGNGSVGVVDLSAGTATTPITGLHEPQGVGYLAETESLFVASAGDGSVRVFRGAAFAPVATIDLKDDADNVRVDDQTAQVFVGAASGALVAIDGRTLAKTAELRLRAHPEGFQLDPAGPHIFVNVPDARQIAVLDRTSGQTIAMWGSPELHANFPMAVRRDGKRILVVYRIPSRMVLFDTMTGAVAANVPACDDADDVFFDERRGRAYVSCGQGVIDVFQMTDTSATRIAEIQTAAGARTSFYDPAMDRLFLAARASGGEAAAIWVFRPR